MITVLRLGHRLGRDTRLSTHVGLVARAFGADRIVYSGQKEESLIRSIHKVVPAWGGPFEAEYVENWRSFIKNFKGAKIHLTMYGLPFIQKIPEVREAKDVLIIIGGEKVPGELYELADYNLAVTNQPHSEAAALGVFLWELFQGKEKTFTGKMSIVPKAKGKKVVNR